jgi:hypothetical protein
MNSKDIQRHEALLLELDQPPILCESCRVMNKKGWRVNDG